MLLDLMSVMHASRSNTNYSETDNSPQKYSRSKQKYTKNTSEWERIQVVYRNFNYKVNPDVRAGLSHSHLV